MNAENNNGNFFNYICSIFASTKDSMNLEIKNSQNMTLFLLVISTAHLGMIHKIITYGANMNAENNNGNFFNYICSIFASTKDSMNLEIKNSQNMTLFLLVISTAHLGMIHKIITYGANMNAENNNGNFFNYICSIFASTKDSMNLEIKNCQNMTLFLLVISTAHLGMIHKFITYGANMNAENNNGNFFNYICSIFASTKDSMNLEIKNSENMTL
ncbi:putative ankyrin repeat protein RF_0381 [Octopus sinensis]|uniref:Ankyrin repeat protein RF_0381 n=1 Tax=Octopus sinensis TaxID=2607531 RepID=A0A6P7STM1_9MOLL|nr:putative ankyrin repeat protein RF_0381 [Octopus sinensis]